MKCALDTVYFIIAETGKEVYRQSVNFVSFFSMDKNCAAQTICG